jgi:outer membrane lipopolysaccharide assembly protein LptE/RlpB
MLLFEVKTMKRVKSILVFTALFYFSGCSYHLIGTGASSLPSHLKTISIPTFINKTREPEIERELTTAVRQSFIRDGRLKVVSAGASADTVLKGEIMDYYLRPISYDASDLVNEYRVLINIEITFEDLVKKKILLQQSLRADEAYKVSATIAGRETLLRETRKIAAEEMAERLRSLVFEGF